MSRQASNPFARFRVQPGKSPGTAVPRVRPPSSEETPMRLALPLLIASLIVAPTALLAGGSDDASLDNRVSNSVKVQPRQRLEIRLHTGAGLLLSGWDRAEVT